RRPPPSPSPPSLHDALPISESPLVINLSLGLLPPVEQLPALWLGRRVDSDSTRRTSKQVALHQEMRLLERPVEQPHLLVERHLRSEEHTSELQSPDHLVCRL